MLEIKRLSVSIQGKSILNEVSVSLKKGEVMVLFGPNGSGKSTLIKSIMGIGGFTVDKGDIIFKGTRINDLTIDARVKLGLGMMYQHPPKIRGVTLEHIASYLSTDREKIQSLAEKLSLEHHLKRDINLGFSGGEMKRSELFQLILQDPDLLLLDEPESGVDLENIALMGRVLDDYLRQEGKSALIITHTGYILDYVKSVNGCVMMGGKFWCVGNPKEMFESIRVCGYEKCKVCECPQKS